MRALLELTHGRFDNDVTKGVLLSTAAGALHSLEDLGIGCSRMLCSADADSCVCCCPVNGQVARPLKKLDAYQVQE